MHLCTPVTSDYAKGKNRLIGKIKQGYDRPEWNESYREDSAKRAAEESDKIEADSK